jgi:hypothetical protein
MSDVEKYIQYYHEQSLGVGGGHKHARTQKGMGVGSFLSSLFRKIAPYIYRGAKAVGGELLSTGANLLRDRINNKDVKESFDTHFGTAGQNLAKEASSAVKSMLGMGYKRKRTGARSQSRVGKQSRKTVKKKHLKLKIPKNQEEKLKRKKIFLTFKKWLHLLLRLSK